jgi:hypothetical protein
MELRNSSLTEVTKGGYPLRGIVCARVKVLNENYEQIQAANRKIRRNTRCMHECCLSNLLNNAVSSTYRHCPRMARTASTASTASTACSPVALYCGVDTSGGYLSGGQGYRFRTNRKAITSRSERHDGILLGLRDARH